jgi:hypothetical protein
MIRLLKNYHKYFYHFGIYPTLYDKELLKYFAIDDLNAEKIGTGSGATQIYKNLKEKIFNADLKNKSREELEEQIRDNHREHIKKFIFTFPDRRDFLIIKFFAGVTKASNKRLFPLCDCGKRNVTGHATDKCALTLKDNDSESYISNFNGLYDEMKTEGKLSLNNYLVHSYLTLTSENLKALKKITILIKEIIAKIIFRDNVDKYEEGNEEKGYKYIKDEFLDDSDEE